MALRKLGVESQPILRDLWTCVASNNTEGVEANLMLGFDINAMGLARHPNPQQPCGVLLRETSQNVFRYVLAPIEGEAEKEIKEEVQSTEEVNHDQKGSEKQHDGEVADGEKNGETPAAKLSTPSSTADTPAPSHNSASEAATALHFGCCCGHVRVVRVLLEKGANPNMATKSGILPLSMAKKNEHIGCVMLMQAVLKGEPLPSEGQVNAAMNVNKEGPEKAKGSSPGTSESKNNNSNAHHHHHNNNNSSGITMSTSTSSVGADVVNSTSFGPSPVPSRTPSANYNPADRQATSAQSLQQRGEASQRSGSDGGSAGARSGRANDTGEVSVVFQLKNCPDLEMTVPVAISSDELHEIVEQHFGERLSLAFRKAAPKSQLMRHLRSVRQRAARLPQTEYVSIADRVMPVDDTTIDTLFGLNDADRIVVCRPLYTTSTSSIKRQSAAGEPTAAAATAAVLPGRGGSALGRYNDGATSAGSGTDDGGWSSRASSRGGMRDSDITQVHARLRQLEHELQADECVHHPVVSAEEEQRITQRLYDHQLTKIRDLRRQEDEDIEERLNRLKRVNVNEISAREKDLITHLYNGAQTLHDAAMQKSCARWVEKLPDVPPLSNEQREECVHRLHNGGLEQKQRVAKALEKKVYGDPVAAKRMNKESLNKSLARLYGEGKDRRAAIMARTDFLFQPKPMKKMSKQEMEVAVERLRSGGKE